MSAARRGRRKFPLTEGQERISRLTLTAGEGGGVEALFVSLSTYAPSTCRNQAPADLPPSICRTTPVTNEARSRYRIPSTTSLI